MPKIRMAVAQQAFRIPSTPMPKTWFVASAKPTWRVPAKHSSLVRFRQSCGPTSRTPRTTTASPLRSKPRLSRASSTSAITSPVRLPTSHGRAVRPPSCRSSRASTAQPEQSRKRLTGLSEKSSSTLRRALTRFSNYWAINSCTRHSSPSVHTRT